MPLNNPWELRAFGVTQQTSVSPPPRPPAADAGPLQLVEDPEVVGSVLGALALARSCLIDADQKATCDAELSAKLAFSTAAAGK